MHKISVPISLSEINNETLPVYLEDLRKCKADRVFLCGLGNIYMKTGRNYTDPDGIRSAIRGFREAGFGRQSILPDTFSMELHLMTLREFQGLSYGLYAP